VLSNSSKWVILPSESKVQTWISGPTNALAGALHGVVLFAIASTNVAIGRDGCHPNLAKSIDAPTSPKNAATPSTSLVLAVERDSFAL